MIRRRRRAEATLLLTWPAAENAESYRLLLRDVSEDELVAKVECPRASHQLQLRHMDAEHQYEWSVQKRTDRFADWLYHLPYLRLFRPTDSPSPTELEWEPTGADAYRVLLNDQRLDLAVVKDALLGTHYPVDWRRLVAGHSHIYSIQGLVRGDDEQWETIHDYRPLPQPATGVQMLQEPEPAAGGTPVPGPRPLIFLWTCDTEVNLRRLYDPVVDRAVELQIFGRDGEREYGINLMMDLLEEFNFRGTFFVDILMEHQIGRQNLEATIEAIVGRGHDLQLHLHPSPHLLFAADRELARFAPALTHDNRDLFRGALDVAVRLFNERVGYAPVAYRSGAYHLCDEYLSVLPEFGITIDSSLYPFKNCRASDWMQTRTEPFWVGDVLEVPVSWMLRTTGSEQHPEFEHEQLAPVKTGAQQDAFAEYRPPGDTAAPATLVYMGHSFSFLSTKRSFDPKAIEGWNRRYRDRVPAEIFSKVEMGTDNEWILFDLPPDSDRIAILTRLLHGLAARTDVVPGTFRELHEGGLDRWRAPRKLPVDTVPVWESSHRVPVSAPMQVYSRGLLERLHVEETQR